MACRLLTCIGEALLSHFGRSSFSVLDARQSRRDLCKASVGNKRFERKDVIVNVRLFGILAAWTRQPFVTLHLPEGAVLGDVIAELGRRFGKDFLDRIVRVPGEMHSYCQMFVNNEQVDDLGRKLEANGTAAEVGLILLMASEGG